MGPGLRKLALTVHLAFSVGWIGAVVAFLALVVTAMTTDLVDELRAAWIGMELTGWRAIVPLALGSLVTGLLLCLGTPWGLFRHYWVLISLVLTVLATAVLLGNMQAVSRFAGIARQGVDVDADRLRRGLASELLHAGVGLVVLLSIHALNVYKPRGMTAYGRRREQEQRESPADLDGRTADQSGTTSRWMKVGAVIAIALVLLFIVLHLSGHLGAAHGPLQDVTSAHCEAYIRDGEPRVRR